MVKKFFIFLIVAIGLCSCDGAEPHLIVTEANKATKELNEKYFDITCGEWYNEVSDSTGKIYEYIYLGKDRKKRTYNKDCDKRNCKNQRKRHLH